MFNSRTQTTMRTTTKLFRAKYELKSIKYWSRKLRFWCREIRIKKYFITSENDIIGSLRRFKTTNGVDGKNSKWIGCRLLELDIITKYWNKKKQKKMDKFVSEGKWKEKKREDKKI